jgi:3-phenylpropionate/cinnamic acid dioxygenase small subunit
MEAQVSSLEERLGRLEDLESIRKLFVLYKRHLDARDWHAYSLLFAREGEWIGGTGSAVGPAAIEAMLSERLGANAPAPGPTHFHLVGLPEIELDGDRATAEVPWALIVRGAEDVPELTLWGHYDDELVREDGEWRFARRVAATDVPHRPLDRG